MKKGIICLLLLCSIGVTLVGCGKKEVSESNESSITQESESVESTPSKFTEDKWEGSSSKQYEESSVSVDEEKGNEHSDEARAESGSEAMSESIVPESVSESTTEPSAESTEEPIKGAEERVNLVNTYADIDLSPYEDYISFEDYSWFKLPEGMFEWDYPTYMSIVCAINEYYGGNVPDNYTCDIKTDVVSEETNMVFKVKVTGKSSTLYVGINGYENTASVEVAE